MKRWRSGFTLIDLMLTIGIIGTLSSIVIAAINPEAQFLAAHDAQRRIMTREFINAVQNYVVTTGSYPGDKVLSSTAMAICRPNIHDASCINLDTLVDDGYLTALPVDVAEDDSNLTGYEIALAEEQPVVTAAYLGVTGSSACEAMFTQGFLVDGNGANGINKDVTKRALSPQVAFAGGTLYVGWQEGQPPQIRVAAYNSNDASPSWSFVDGNGQFGLNKDAGQSAASLELSELNGKLYATWSESGGGAYQIRVAVYSGGDWDFVDGNSSTGINKDVTRNALAPYLAVNGGKLYAGWNELNDSGIPQARVAVYNGNDGAPDWTFVDGDGANGINKDGTKNAFGPQLSSFGGKLYATWFEAMPQTFSYQVRAAVYNGNDGAPVWSFVGGSGPNGINKNSGYDANSPSLVVFKNQLYGIWDEGNSAGVDQIRVAAYNGNDGVPEWDFVDGNGANGINKDTSRSAWSPQLAVSGGKLYATWAEALNP
ncbi:MAG TPA: hypothetical protein VI913_00805, partial [Candidatus Peribacteraceae bacterium]|nr:hypothetical protein [Candidatus Peribacteraceae bacterium]